MSNDPLGSVDPLGLAYFANRPLEGSGIPWLGPLSDNPLDNALNTNLSHEQLFFEDGKLPSNVGFTGDGTLQSEPEPVGYHPEPGSYNDCLIRQAYKNVKLKPYHRLGNNCQDWSDDVRNEYTKLLQDKTAKKECSIQ